MENKDQNQSTKYYLVKIKKFPNEIDYTKQFPNLEQDGFLEVYAVLENGILMTIYPTRKIQDGTKNYNSQIIDLEKFVLNNECLLGVEKREVSIHDVSRYIKFPSDKIKEDYRKILEYSESTIKYVKEQYKKLQESEKNFQEEINKGRR